MMEEKEKYKKRACKFSDFKQITNFLRERGQGSPSSSFMLCLKCQLEYAPVQFLSPSIFNAILFFSDSIPRHTLIVQNTTFSCV